MTKTIVVNLLAGPGAGKSTIAAATFAALKWNEVNVELVTEYAKDVVWEESFKILDDQILVFGKQLHRINILLGKVDVIVTDAPLINSVLYYKGNHKSTFLPLVLDVINSMDNMNYFIERKKIYNPIGRLQTAQEAAILDDKIFKLLLDYNIPFSRIVGIPQAASDICGRIISYLKAQTMMMKEDEGSS